MAKTLTQTTPATAVKSHWGRGRVVEFPSEPTRVTEKAQAGVPTENNNDFTRQSSRSKLPERPSTSRGPSGKLLTRKNAENRETKDDLGLHFNPITAHGRGTTFYNFPLPGALPTPASTPK